MGLFRSSMRDKHVRSYSDRELFKRYIKRLASYRKNIVFIALFIVIQAIAAVTSPLLIGFITDELGQTSPRYVLIIIAAVALDRLRHHRVVCVGARDVDLASEGLAARLADLLRGALGAFAVDVGDAELRPFFGQELCG